MATYSGHIFHLLGTDTHSHLFDIEAVLLGSAQGSSAKQPPAIQSRSGYLEL
jgi:hypothetical protein